MAKKYSEKYVVVSCEKDGLTNKRYWMTYDNKDDAQKAYERLVELNNNNNREYYISSIKHNEKLYILVCVCTLNYKFGKQVKKETTVTYFITDYKEKCSITVTKTKKNKKNTKVTLCYRIDNNNHSKEYFINKAIKDAKKKGVKVYDKNIYVR